MREDIERTELVRLRQIDRRLRMLFLGSEEWNLGLLALLDEPDALKRLVTEPHLLPSGPGWESKKALEAVRAVRELVLGTTPDEPTGFIHPTALVGEPPEHREHRFSPLLEKYHDPVVSGSAILEAYVTVDAGLEQPTRVGAYAYLMKKSHVGHDAQVGDNVNIAPLAVVGGHCVLGARTKIGLGASIRPRVTVGEDVVVGAGAVVVKDVPSGEVWAGNPAHRINNRPPAEWESREAEYDAWMEWYEAGRANGGSRDGRARQAPPRAADDLDAMGA